MARVPLSAGLLRAGRQDVAAPAAADEDLAAPIRRALEEKRLGVGGGGEDRRHRSGRAGSDYGDPAQMASRGAGVGKALTGAR